MNWKNEFRKRVVDFETNSKVKEEGLSISIKIKAIYECFHREHSPNAYKIIDKFLDNNFNKQEQFFFQEHESGPEILLYLTLTAAGIQLGANIIDLITTIIKAHSNGLNKGDRNNQLELIIRYFNGKGNVKEERLIKVDPMNLISREEIHNLLDKSTNMLFLRKRYKKKK